MPYIDTSDDDDLDDYFSARDVNNTKRAVTGQIPRDSEDMTVAELAVEQDASTRLLDAEIKITRLETDLAVANALADKFKDLYANALAGVKQDAKDAVYEEDAKEYKKKYEDEMAKKKRLELKLEDIEDLKKKRDEALEAKHAAEREKKDIESEFNAFKKQHTNCVPKSEHDTVVGHMEKYKKSAEESGKLKTTIVELQASLSSYQDTASLVKACSNAVEKKKSELSVAYDRVSNLVQKLNSSALPAEFMNYFNQIGQCITNVGESTVALRDELRKANEEIERLRKMAEKRVYTTLDGILTDGFQVKRGKQTRKEE